MATEEEAERLMRLFEGNEQFHGTHGEPVWDDGKSKWTIRSTARTLNGPAALPLWLAHLDGRAPLGVVPIMQGDRCRWGSIDVDDYTVDEVRLMLKIEGGKYPLVVVRSKSGGLHLFVFFVEPELAAEVQAVLRDLRAALGLASSEIFPKQSRLIDDRDKGSWIVMPYFGGTYKSNEYPQGKLKHQHGIKASGSEMDLREFLEAAEAARTTVRAIKIKRAPKPRVNGHAINNTAAAFGNGPPCLEHMAGTGVADNRDDVMFMMGIYAKMAYPDDWRARVEEYNNLYISPSGSAEWVAEKIKSLEKKEYAYICANGTKDPMARFCNKVLCRARSYGIMKGGAAIPSITEIRKYNAEPPTFYVQADDLRLRLSVDQLLDYRKFAAAALIKADSTIIYGPMKDADWKALLGVAMQDCVIDPPTPDSGDLPTFVAYLRVYLFYRGVSQSVPDMVASGKPFEDKEGEIEGPEYAGCYYVTLTHIAEFMKKGGLTFDSGGQSRVATSEYVRSRLSDDLGAVHHKLNYKSTSKNLWRLPSEMLSLKPPDELLPLPPPKESKI